MSRMKLFALVEREPRSPAALAKQNGFWSKFASDHKSHDSGEADRG